MPKKKNENEKLPVTITENPPKRSKVEDSFKSCDNGVILEYIPNPPTKKKQKRMTIETGEFIYDFFN
jgi:hypothetical protein